MATMPMSMTFDAGGADAVGERRRKLGPGQAAVAADRDRVAAALDAQASRAPGRSARTTAGVSVLPTMPRMS